LLRFFASQLHAGTITLIALANKLVGVPILFAGAAVSISVMPSIVVAIQKREAEEIERKLLQAVTAVTLLMWPVLLFYELLAPSIVFTVFGNGALTGTQLTELGAILRAYAGAVLGLSVVLVLNSFLAAFGRTRTVIVAGVITVCINAISMAMVVGHWGAPGIALALTVGTFIYAGLLALALGGSIGFRSIGRLLPPVTRVIVGGFPLYIGVLAAGQLSRFLGWHSLIELSVQLVLGGSAYLGWLQLQSSKIDMGIFTLRVGTGASGWQSFEASNQLANIQQDIETPLATEVAHEREIR
jgi:putative peptidoglycan lipid II flippase